MMQNVGDIDETIVDLTVWHLALPVVSRRDHGIGTVADRIEVVVVRLVSESGVKGYGEGAPWTVFTGTPEASYAAIHRYFRPLLVGARIGDFEYVMAQVQKAVVHCGEAKAAVEAALLDLIGRLLQRPAWALLGEKCRSEIPLSVSLANPDFDRDLELVERLVDDGIGLVKLKTGFKDDEFDEMRIAALRKRFPRLGIRVDYNQGLDSRFAIERVSRLDCYAPEFIEQPVAAHDFETMAAIRDAISAPLLADESVFAPEDMGRAVREGICDGVSIKIMKSGGIRRGMQIAEIAGNAGLPGYGGDMFETGLAHLAGIHMIAVSPNISLGCEFYQAKYYLTEDLLEAPLTIVQGKVQVPDDPGLGLAVDEDRLEKYAVRRGTR